MTEVMLVLVRGPLRGVVASFASVIGEDTKLAELEEIARRFRGLVGEELVMELDQAFGKALENEVRRALNSLSLIHI